MFINNNKFTMLVGDGDADNEEEKIGNIYKLNLKLL